MFYHNGKLQHTIRTHNSTSVKAVLRKDDGEGARGLT